MASKYFLFLLPLSLIAAPLSIEEAESRALKSGLTILASKEEYTSVQKERSGILSAWLPQAFFTWNIKKYERPSTVVGDEKGTYSGSFDLTQTVFDLKLLREYQRAAFDVKSADLEIAQSSIDTLFAVRENYYACILSRELAQVRTDKIALLTEAFEETKRRHELGMATLFDVRQSEVFVKNAEPPLRTAERAALHTQDTLTELLGLAPSERDFEVPQEPIPIDQIKWLQGKEGLNQEDFKRWEVATLEMAPSILLAKSAEERACAHVRVKQADYAPRVDGFFTVSSSETAKWNQQTWEWQTGVALRVPIFEGLGRKRAVNAAQARRRARRFDLRRAKLSKLVSVRSDLYAIDEQLANVQSTGEAFILSEMALVQAQDKYKLGMIELIDYKTAIDNLFVAKLRYHTARFELLRAYFGLVRTSGADLVNIMKEKSDGK